MRPLSIVLFLLALALLSRVGDGSAEQDGAPADFAGPAEVLVRYADATSDPARSARPLAAESAYNERLDVWRLRLRPGTSVEDALAGLRSDPNVVVAQRNYTYVAARSPDDPDFDPYQQPYYSVINAQAGWEIETGSADVVVAVLDGGVDTTHPELAAGAWTNPLEEPNGADDDGNGCTDDVHGCSFLTDAPDGDVHDRDGHGTFVAGVIGADSDNDKGVAGVAWEATIMAVRVLDETGVGTTEQLAAGILYAAENGADVANLSLALVPEAGACLDDEIVEEALRTAHDDFGTTVVAAAGNFDIGCVAYPASSVNTIAVGGSGPPSDPDTRAFFAQWGPEVDVAAPAMEIYSTRPNNAYGLGEGTSFASPIVAGAAALLLSQDPARSPEDVRALLRDSARNVHDDQRPNWDGAGILDLGAALGGESAFATVDVTAERLADVRLTVTVGDSGSPLCTADVWSNASAFGSSVHGSFGLGPCGAHWPPSAAQPWHLVGSTSGAKAATLRAWSVRTGDASCAASGLPIPLPRSEGAVATIACASEGVVLNDRPSQALPVDTASVPRRYEQDIRYATGEGDPALSCAGQFSRSVWYAVGPGAGTAPLAVDTFGTAFDTVLAVFTPDADGGLVEVACNDEFGPSQSRLVWGPDGVSTYYVMAAAFQTVPAGRLKLNVSHASIPPNDTREGASPLPQPGDLPVVQPAHSATGGADDPALSCVAFYGSSIWFAAPGTLSSPLTLSTLGSDYDTVLAVLAEGPGGALTEVACSDDVAADVRTSQLTWEPAAGQTYKILVGSFGDSAGGALRLSAETP